MKLAYLLKVVYPRCVLCTFQGQPNWSRVLSSTHYWCIMLFSSVMSLQLLERSSCITPARPHSIHWIECACIITYVWLFWISALLITLWIIISNPQRARIPGGARIYNKNNTAKSESPRFLLSRLACLILDAGDLPYNSIVYFRQNTMTSSVGRWSR